jgi:hypothetical protein
VGSPEEVTRELKASWEKSGGFGTLLLITGKSWSTREKRDRSLRRFMAEEAMCVMRIKVGSRTGMNWKRDSVCSADAGDLNFFGAWFLFRLEQFAGDDLLHEGT